MGTKTEYIRNIERLILERRLCYNHIYIALVNEETLEPVATVSVQYDLYKQANSFGFYELRGNEQISQPRHSVGFPSLESTIINAEITLGCDLLPAIRSGFDGEQKMLDTIRDQWSTNTIEKFYAEKFYAAEAFGTLTTNTLTKKKTP